jgi:hypothetical protein
MFQSNDLGASTACANTIQFNPHLIARPFRLADGEVRRIVLVHHVPRAWAITPGQPKGPSVGDFHSIACNNSMGGGREP